MNRTCQICGAPAGACNHGNYFKGVSIKWLLSGECWLRSRSWL